jgi:hypothetical protein
MPFCFELKHPRDMLRQTMAGTVGCRQIVRQYYTWFGLEMHRPLFFNTTHQSHLDSPDSSRRAQQQRHCIPPNACRRTHAMQWHAQVKPLKFTGIQNRVIRVIPKLEKKENQPTISNISSLHGV